MEEIRFRLDEKGDGAFYIPGGRNGWIAEMLISLSGKTLTALHTEVLPEAAGKGLAKKLFAALVAYAREQGLKVIAYCPFVLAQFKRHPEAYADIWLKPAV
jgi:predicted GNAT family acetyltransferase